MSGRASRAKGANDGGSTSIHSVVAAWRRALPTDLSGELGNGHGAEDRTVKRVPNLLAFGLAILVLFVAVVAAFALPPLRWPVIIGGVCGIAGLLAFDRVRARRSPSAIAGGGGAFEAGPSSPIDSFPPRPGGPPLPVPMDATSGPSRTAGCLLGAGILGAAFIVVIVATATFEAPSHLVRPSVDQLPTKYEARAEYVANKGIWDLTESFSVSDATLQSLRVGAEGVELTPVGSDPKAPAAPGVMDLIEQRLETLGWERAGQRGGAIVFRRTSEVAMIEPSWPLMANHQIDPSQPIVDHVQLVPSEGSVLTLVEPCYFVAVAEPSGTRTPCQGGRDQLAVTMPDTNRLLSDEPLVRLTIVAGWLQSSQGASLVSLTGNGLFGAFVFFVAAAVLAGIAELIKKRVSSAGAKKEPQGTPAPA
jgi:hypothetical protein